MRILFLTQIIPYPPDAGPRIKTWHVLRYLAECGHEVTLASFVRPEEEAYLPVVRQVCAQVYPIPIHRSRGRDIRYGLQSLISGMPFLMERDNLAAMRTLVQHLVSTGEVDVIHCDQLPMAQFALPNRNTGKMGTASAPIGQPAARRPFRIFDAHNAVWKIVERMRQSAPWFVRPALTLEAKKIKRFEGYIARTFDQTLAVTDLDRDALLEAAANLPGGIWPAGVNGAPMEVGKAASIQVIPIAVDTVDNAPVPRQPGSKEVLTLGTLRYPPNADGIRWFARDVFPRVREQVPDAQLTILGRNPPQDFLQMAARSDRGICVTGYVPDLTPYLERAAVLAIPVRAGGGMRVRILEALSRGIPIVTTPVGLEGIEAQPGKELLVADTPEEFAAAVLRLLGDPDLQMQLVQRGRRLAETVYDRRVVQKKLGVIYERMADQTRAIGEKSIE